MRAIDEIAVQLEALERDPALAAVENFRARTEALDALEADVLERLAQMAGAGAAADELQALRRRAGSLRRRLEAANLRLCEQLRTLIRSGRLRGEELERRLRAYAGYGPDAAHAGGQAADAGYDSLDALVSGLLLMLPPPIETRARAPDMVYYQPTPARITLELVAKAGLSPQDVFYDIGSGLGQVVILVHLLTGVRARGVEYEPAYCAYAQRCADNLGLAQAAFVNADAREADLSEGTVFYMYTPFGGQMLERVLRRLAQVARARPIRLLTYGPCTLAVAQQDWLARPERAPLDPEHVAVFYTP